MWSYIADVSKALLVWFSIFETLRIGIENSFPAWAVNAQAALLVLMTFIAAWRLFVLYDAWLELGYYDDKP